jgi:hypothetical protein
MDARSPFETPLRGRRLYVSLEGSIFAALSTRARREDRTAQAEAARIIRERLAADGELRDAEAARR